MTYTPITFHKRPTAQQLFDAIAAHLLRQHQKAVGVKGCAYRGEHDLMCAVGCVIPNSRYRAKMEGSSIMGLLGATHSTAGDFRDVLPAWFQEHDDLLQALQSVHDNEPVAEWSRMLRLVAADFNLTARV